MLMEESGKNSWVLLEWLPRSPGASGKTAHRVWRKRTMHERAYQDQNGSAMST
jgi:hypothetical protein